MWFRKFKVAIDTDNALQFYYGANPGFKYDIKPELSIWLFEYCKGKWSIKPKYKKNRMISVSFSFSNKADAMYFKLVHHGIQN